MKADDILLCLFKWCCVLRIIYACCIGVSNVSIAPRFALRIVGNTRDVTATVESGGLAEI